MQGSIVAAYAGDADAAARARQIGTLVLAAALALPSGSAASLEGGAPG
jgi:hypothetical protein